MTRPDGDSSATPESQRRHATVLFADISGFTAMSERLDPEEVTDIMNDCFTRLERIVHAHGGQIDKYIGDAVMALFGAGHALEHAARHGVAAALEIREALVRFNQERRLPVPLRVHVGVNSGIVIAGEVGGAVKRDFTVMGDTVNLAARLEDASDTGQIFVGPTTYAETAADFEYRPTKRLTLKGKAEPVQAYEVLGPATGAGTGLAATARHVTSRFVGRERELAAIRERLVRLRAGEGGIVTVVGDAGLGKSRLLHEMTELPERAGAVLLVGRSEALGGRGGYQAFAGLLGDWLGFRAEDDEAASRQKLEDAVRALAPDAAADLLPFLATFMGWRPTAVEAERLHGIAGEALESLIAKAVHDLVVRLAAAAPLVLCFEDVHWADGSSVKLLESLLRLATERAVLFVLAYRPGFDETAERVAAVARARYADRLLEIVLAPLTGRDVAALVRNLLRVEALPEAVRRVIAEKAEGNPFYLEEVVRTLIDHEAVEVRDGALVATDRIESITVPGTVQEVILTRVERLPIEARRVLQVAAVIGRSFYQRLLAEVTGLADEALAAVIALLEERQVLKQRHTRRTASVRRQQLMAEREYVFTHALIAETLYESMLNRTRKELHLKVAEAIERCFADRLRDFLGLLALHYTRAERLVEAERYLLAAGEEAVRTAASSEALGYFREAYRVYRVRHPDGGDPQKRLQLEKQIASAMLLTGNLTEARPYFDRALQLLGERVARNKRHAYRQLAGDVGRMLFRVYVRRGRPATRPATPELRDALNLLYARARVESVADPEWFLFDSMYMVGRLSGVDPRSVDQAVAQWAGVSLLFSFSGLSFALSRRIARLAQSLLREQRPAELFTYHLMTFMCDYFEGRWQQPTGIDDELIERVLRTGQLWDVDTFLGFDAGKQIDQGNWDAADARWRTIARIAGEYGYGFAETNKMAIPIFAALARRDLERVLVDVERYLERPEEKLRLIGLGAKAKALVLLGRSSEAQDVLDAAATLLRRLGLVTPFHRAWYEIAQLLHDVTELERALGRGDAARSTSLRRRAVRDLRRALRTSRVLALMRTETHRLAGTLHWLGGKRRRAIHAWERAVDEGARLGARPELARTHAEIAVRCAAAGSDLRVAGLTAAEHAAVAERAFAELGLAADLAALQRVFGLGAGPPAGARSVA